MFAAENLLWSCANYYPQLDEEFLKLKMISFIEKIGFAHIYEVYFCYFLEVFLAKGFGTVPIDILQEEDTVINERG